MLREQPLNAGEEAYGRPSTKQNGAPDSREQVLACSLSLQFCSLCREGRLDLIGLVPEQKVPAGHIHTKCLAGVKNVSSVSHVYLSYAKSTWSAAGHLLLSWNPPSSPPPQPLVIASQRGCLRALGFPAHSLPSWGSDV